MDFEALFRFLATLEKNNSKAWMDANRKQYTALRHAFIAWLAALDRRLVALDPAYYQTPASKAMNRINNNLKFHPNRPVYKDHFGAGLDQAPGSGDFYIQIGPNESLLAGGLWRPGPEKLRSIRDAIDYNGEELKKILSGKTFQQTFGSLYEDDSLQTAPKGFAKDHPHIDLLRHRTFAVVHRLSMDEVLHPDFSDRILQVYMEMLPFRRYLNEAITV